MTERSDHLIERAAAKFLATPDRMPTPETHALLKNGSAGSHGQNGSLPRQVFQPIPSAGVGDQIPATDESIPDIEIADDFPGPIPLPNQHAGNAVDPVERTTKPQTALPSIATAALGEPTGLNLSDPATHTLRDATTLDLSEPTPLDTLPSRIVQPNNSALSNTAKPATPSLGFKSAPTIALDVLERAGMVVARTSRTRISEEYRISVGRILRLLHDNADNQAIGNVVMVTSARPGEGKSFTALNLAGSIAQNGTDAVLLVDVDPKQKPMSWQLGLDETPGFLDLVSDPSQRPEDLLQITAIPNLAFMPVGTRIGGAAQTMGGAANMRPIIPTVTRLSRRFPKHLIILDAPPCLSTSDPHTLAPHVSQVLLVVEAERTQKTEVEAALDLVRVCPSITILLNKIRMTTSHTFGAYDYFGSYS